MQSHVAIQGRTLSGKSTLAKQLVTEYRNKGTGSIVLDPMYDAGWKESGAEYVAREMDPFKEAIEHSRGCAIFIDEGGDYVNRFNTDLHFTATKGRHWGHRCHYIFQKSTQVAPVIRDMCTYMYLFAISFDDSKLTANEWGRPEVKEAYKLQAGEYFAFGRFGELKKGNIFED